MSQNQLAAGISNLSLWQKYQLITDPLGMLEKCAKTYGDIFILPISPNGIPQTIVSNPKAIEKIFKANYEQLDSGTQAGIQPFLIGERSMLAISGERHKRERKLLMPAFHGERMKSYGELIRDISLQVSDRWTIARPFSMRESMQEITFTVILKAVFGLKDGLRYQKLTQLLNQRLEGSQSILRAMLLFIPLLRKNWGPLSPWGRLMQIEQQIDELIYAEIAERRSQLDSDRTDILSLMMAAKDENGEPMSDLELRDELMTLLIAGHETTATSLAWAFYWIHHVPEVKEKLLEELDTLGEGFDFDRVIKLPYLNAVCLETLRIYPVAMFALARLVKSTLEIGEYRFEPGTILAPCIYLTHHREDLYPAPKQFKPERFLERQFSAYEYLPFGGGNRRCLGYAFALFEMKIVLATVLSGYTLELAERKPVKAVRRGLLTAPSTGVRMALKAKRSPVPQEVQPLSM